MAKLTAFTMPKWGIEMTEGTVAEWLVAEAQPFKRSAMLALIETDKITNEVEAEADGCFVKLIAEVGQAYPVGALLGVLGEVGASAAEIAAFIARFNGPAGSGAAGSEASNTPTMSPSNLAAAVVDRTIISPSANRVAKDGGMDIETIIGTARRGRISLQDVHQAQRAPVRPVLKGVYEVGADHFGVASPMARRLALWHGIDIGGVAGTGPRGRISKADILALVPEPAVGGPPVVVPMSKMRKVIARRLSASKATIPHFYVRRRVRADRLLALRAAASPKPSINDYLVRACALALAKVPALNIQVHGDEIHRFSSADIAVAVSTDGGLITPIVQNAQALSAIEINSVMADLADRARSNRLKQHEFEGGSFSLSNLGMFGVEQFDAIINPPQGAILAVGAARPEAIDDDGAFRLVPVLHLSLSCDHRAIDGADAGRFMAALAELIENPQSL